nr:hypothetical protein [Tanacetum cinerariifolium]
LRYANVLRDGEKGVNHLSLYALAIKDGLNLGSCDEAKKDLKVLVQPFRVVQRVIGNCVNGEGDRVKVKLVGEFVSNRIVVAILWNAHVSMLSKVAKERSDMYALLWNCKVELLYGSPLLLRSGSIELRELRSQHETECRHLLEELRIDKCKKIIYDITAERYAFGTAEDYDACYAFGTAEGSTVGKKHVKDKKTTKQKKIGSPSIGRNLKIKEMLRKKNAEIEAKRIAEEEKAAKKKKKKRLKDIKDEKAKSADEEANLVEEHASEQAEWEAQYNHLRKPTPWAIALQMSGTTKADFMLKINFLTLFESIMGTLENSGRVLKRPSIRSWNTQMMRKRIMMETSKGCLGNIKHHENFDPDEEQNGIDLYKGLDVYIEPLSKRKPVKKVEFYEKIIEKFTKILKERSELIETLRKGMTKFGEDQGISNFYDQYKNLFKDAEFNLYDSSMDMYSESESESDAGNNKKNDDENEKEKRNDVSKGTEEAGREQKDDEEDDQDDLNNEHEFENLIGDDREVAFSMKVDETENKKEKQTEIVKEQEAEKKKEKQAENKEKRDDIRKGTEEAGSETKNDEDEVHTKVDGLNERMKDKVADKQNVNDGNENEKDKQDEHHHLTQNEFWNEEKATTDEVMMTEYLFSMEGEEFDFVFETKDGAATIKDYMQTLAPQLKVESNVIDTFSLTKDMFNWKKANGKYDEEKQFEAFSKTIKSEFKNDTKMENMKDLEMAFFPIIAHEHYYMSYSTS